jgi:hypothetical protein
MRKGAKINKHYNIVIIEQKQNIQYPKPTNASYKGAARIYILHIGYIERQVIS